MRVYPRIGAKSASQHLEPALAVLAGRQHGVVAAWQLLRIGFSRKQIEHRVRTRRLQGRFRGVYAVGHAAVTREGRWLAAVLAAGRGAVLSHRDAAALWGLADYAGAAIEMTVPGTGSRDAAGLRIHRTRHLHPSDISSHRSIPVTSPARTLLDLATMIAPRHVELASEEALRRGVVSVEAVREQVERNPGRKGAPLLRDLLGRAPANLARTKSRLEARFLRFCAEDGPPAPRSQRLRRRLRGRRSLARYEPHRRARQLGVPLGPCLLRARPREVDGPVRRGLSRHRRDAPPARA